VFLPFYWKKDRGKRSYHSYSWIRENKKGIRERRKLKRGDLLNKTKNLQLGVWGKRNIKNKSTSFPNFYSLFKYKKVKSTLITTKYK